MSTLPKRIADLLQILTKGLPEREYEFQLAFLATFMGDPFYLYGRSGSGKKRLIKRLSLAFKDARKITFGKREQAVPADFRDFDLVFFNNFSMLDEKTTSCAQMALLDKEDTSVILSGEERAESALSKVGISDWITLSIMLPDSIPSAALCKLLQNSNTLEDLDIPADLTISMAERKEWQNAIKQVTLSQETLDIIGKIAEICEENGIYVSIRRWISLSNITKAIAFFNGRTETVPMDAFFLGTPIWGRPASNKVVGESFLQIFRDSMLKGLPEISTEQVNVETLLEQANFVAHSSNNRYDTKLVHDELCVYYRITVSGEQVPIYVPLHMVESDKDFYPYNELGREEKHVRCNFHGKTSCTISINSAAKGSNFRNYTQRAMSNMSGNFEEFATLPTYILKENDPEIIEKKKEKAEELRKTIQVTTEQETQKLLALKEVYKRIKAAQNELFSNKTFLEKTMADIKALFDASTETVQKMKDAYETLAKAKL